MIIATTTCENYALKHGTEEYYRLEYSVDDSGWVGYNDELDPPYLATPLTNFGYTRQVCTHEVDDNVGIMFLPQGIIITLLIVTLSILLFAFKNQTKQ